MTWISRNGLAPETRLEIARLDLMAGLRADGAGYCVRLIIAAWAAECCGRSRGGSFLRIPGRRERMLVVRSTTERTVQTCSN